MGPSGADAQPAAPSSSLRRTWPQRLTIALAIVGAVGCFATGSVLFAAQQVVEDRNIVVIDKSSSSAARGDADDNSTFESTAPGAASSDAEPATSEPSAPVETFPPAEPAARNFLITGADNNSCIDPDSRFAPAFGDRGSLGERSDTIMMWRVNPATSQVAVLSFPRDLYVKIAGRSAKRRINEAYERDQPQRLIDTISNEFGLPTDHFIQIDFCAFKTLVDAVGGVAVPFARPVRDVNTGLDVPEPGCFTFTGDHALAYVRSRKMQVFTENGSWSSDTGDDRARISRQQDFIRRTADSLLAAGAFNPAVIRALIETSDDYIVNDVELTLDKMLEFAGVLRTIDPATITTYQIEASSQRIQGADVLVPRIGGSNMKAILSVFRGEATLASAPEQVFDTISETTVAASIARESQSSSGETAEPMEEVVEVTTPSTTSPAPTTTEAQPFTPLPEVEAEDITYGLVPDASIRCD